MAKNEVEKAKKRGEWNLVIYKSRATRWEYFLENPQGGGQGSSSYTSEKGAINAATARVLWGDKKRYFLIIAKWSPEDEDYKVTKSEWRKIPEKAAASLRSDLIRLAADNPEVRAKVLPLLKESATVGESYPEVKAIVHRDGVTLSVSVGITGAGMEVSSATRRLEHSVDLIRKVMNGGLMKAVTTAAGDRLSLGKFYVNQDIRYAHLVNVHTLLYLSSLDSDKIGAVAEAIKPWIKGKNLEYKK